MQSLRADEMRVINSEDQIDIWRDWFIKSFRKPVKQNPKFGKRK